MANYLANDIKFVAGVGEARARLLEKLGIRTLGDMLCHYPFRYIDRTRIYRSDQIAEGDSALIQFRGASQASAMPERAQTTFHGRRERRQRRGRTGLVPGNQMDRKTDRSGARIPDFRPPILLQGRTVGGTSRNRNHRESLFPQGRKRSARHLLLDRAAFERPRHQRHLHDRLQPLADGAGPYPRNAARPNADPVRSAVAARCALQHPFSAIARTAAAGTIPAEVRRATRHSTGYPIAPHCPPVENNGFLFPKWEAYSIPSSTPGCRSR